MVGEVDSSCNDFGQESGPIKDWVLEQINKLLEDHVNDCGVGGEKVGKPGRAFIRKDDATRDDWSGEVVREELVEFVITGRAVQIESGHGVRV